MLFFVLTDVTSVVTVSYSLFLKTCISKCSSPLCGKLHCLNIFFVCFTCLVTEMSEIETERKVVDFTQVREPKKRKAEEVEKVKKAPKKKKQKVDKVHREEIETEGAYNHFLVI